MPGMPGGRLAGWCQDRHRGGLVRIDTVTNMQVFYNVSNSGLAAYRENGLNVHVDCRNQVQIFSFQEEFEALSSVSFTS